MKLDEVERQKRVAGLLRERLGFLQPGNDEAVAVVDSQLKLYGYEQKRTIEEARRTAPQGRTEQRPVQITKK